MVVRTSKITGSFSVSRLADEKLEEMVDMQVFANRSNAVESSLILMYFILNANTILPAAAQMGIKPLPVGGSV